MVESISVIVPTFNSSASLPRAIESIREQNWPGLDIVVVDDGSTDDTSATMKCLAKGDLKFVAQCNRGPGAARNRGIMVSKSKWVAFLDADDFWLPGKLTAQFDLLRSDSAFRFCYSDSVRQMTDGVRSIHRPRGTSSNIFSSLLAGPQFDLPTVIVRRDCFQRVGLFAPELRTGEDWDMWLRLSASYRGCYIPKPLIFHYVSGDPNKYPMDVYERCQMRILERLFSDQEIARYWPQLSRHRGKIYSWHRAVLAKSYLFQRQWCSFLRLAVASIQSHPLGFYFLARKWGTAEKWPEFAGTSANEGRCKAV